MKNLLAYEIVRGLDGNVSLIGPISGVRQITPGPQQPRDYAYVQILDGKPVAAFRTDEIAFIAVGPGTSTKVEQYEPASVLGDYQSKGLAQGV